MEYGPVSDDRRQESRAILQYAFSPESGPDPEAYDDEWPPTLFDQRALVDDEGIASVCKRYFLDARVRGEWTELGGLGAVATPPERRREGNVRRLVERALEEYREAGVKLVALWPFDTPFYRHLGWGTANERTVFELPPEQLSFGRDARGRVRRRSADDWEWLRSIESAAGRGVGLSLRRSEAWWRERTLSDWAGDAPYVYGYERDGAGRGYVIYTIEDTGDGRRLDVGHLAAVDDDAERGLLGFLADHDSQVETVRLVRGGETTLLYRVDDPEAVECTVTAGPMVRLTDVGLAMRQFPWPDELEASVTLRIEDPLLERNDGTVELSIADGECTVADAPGASPDAAVDLPTLSQLYVGTHGVDDAERVAKLDVRDDDAREVLRAAFPPQSVRLNEFF